MLFTTGYIYTNNPQNCKTYVMRKAYNKFVDLILSNTLHMLQQHRHLFLYVILPQNV
jgi:hypothetical protein